MLPSEPVVDGDVVESVLDADVESLGSGSPGYTQSHTPMYQLDGSAQGKKRRQMGFGVETVWGAIGR